MQRLCGCGHIFTFVVTVDFLAETEEQVDFFVEQKCKRVVCVSA